MNISKNIKLIMLSFLILGTGCATSKINEAEVSKVKKVAVVAFSANLPASQKLSLDVMSGKTSGEQGGNLLTETSLTINQILHHINQSFIKNKNWQVLETNTMKMNPAYIQAYKSTMDGWQNKMPAGAGTKDYVVKDVMDKDGLRLLGPEGKKQLIQALKVDAVIAVNVTTNLEGFTVMGIGKRKPQSSVLIQVYNENEDSPIWFESFKGDESEDSVGMTGFIDEEKLQTLSLASVKTALKKIK